VPSLSVDRLEQLHNVFEDGRHVNRAWVVGVVGLCNKTEKVLTQPLDISPVMGECERVDKS
jgi:hypothetical protein